MERKQSEKQGTNPPLPQMGNSLDYQLLFNAVSKNISEQAILLDTNGRFLFINATTANYLHRKPESLIGTHYSEFLNQEESKALDRVLQQVVSGQKFQKVRFSATIQGEQRTFLVTSEPVQNSTGQVMGILVLADDITQEIQAKEDLANAQAFQRSLIDNLQEAIIVIDDNGKPLDVNPAAIDMFGFSQEDFLADDDRLFSILPSDLVMDQVMDLIKSQGFATGELKLKRKGGEEFIFLFYAMANTSPGQHIVVGRDITRQKELEQELIQSELRYRTLFNSATDAILIMEENVFIDCNPTAVTMFGCTEKSEILNRSPWDFSPQIQPDESPSREKSAALIQKALVGEPQNYIWKYRKLDGTLFDAEITLNRISIDEKNYLQALVRDITKRKKAEEALQESEARYSSLVNVSPSAIFIIQDKKYVFANPAAAKILGYEDPDQVINMDVEKTLSPPYRELAKERITQTLAGETNEFAIIELQQPNGTTRQIESFSIPYKYNDRPASLVIGMDVTDRLTQENMLSTFYKAAPLGVGIVVGRKIIQANEMFCQMTGYDLHEILNQDSRMLYFNDEDYQLVGIQKDEQMNKFGVATTESRFRQKDGSSIDVLISSIPFDKDDWSKGINTVVLDISERKQAERMLQNLNIELEERVKVRTQQLEKKTVELESFSYSVSHDLRAPLRAVNGLSQILLADYAKNWDDAPKELLHNIIAASRKMDQQIDGLLTLSRLGQKHLSPTHTDIGALATQVFHELADQITGRQITFSVKDTRSVYADRQLLEIALTNLISNAVKFTRPRPHAAIEFGLDHQGDETVYYLKDNGIGFDQKYADKLFTPFQRLESDEDFEGTGIGLTIVKRIVDRHRGDIWVKSTKGEGTTFFFSLNMPPSEKKQNEIDL